MIKKLGVSKLVFFSPKLVLFNQNYNNMSKRIIIFF